MVEQVVALLAVLSVVAELAEVPVLLILLASVTEVPESELELAQVVAVRVGMLLAEAHMLEPE